MAAALRASILRHVRKPVSQIRVSLITRYYSAFHQTEEEIAASSFAVLQSTPHIKLTEHVLPLTFHHPTVADYSLLDKFRVLSRVLDVANTYPHLDHKEIFYLRVAFRSLVFQSDKNMKDLTRDEVTSQFLELLKICPSVDPSKDTHFEQDLGMDTKGARYELGEVIRTMFRLEISDELASGFETVKDAVDYVCSHLHETGSPREEKELIQLFEQYVILTDCLPAFRTYP